MMDYKFYKNNKLIAEFSTKIFKKIMKVIEYDDLSKFSYLKFKCHKNRLENIYYINISIYDYFFHENHILQQKIADFEICETKIQNFVCDKNFKFYVGIEYIYKYLKKSYYGVKIYLSKNKIKYIKIKYYYPTKNKIYETYMINIEPPNLPSYFSRHTLTKVKHYNCINIYKFNKNQFLNEMGEKYVIAQNKNDIYIESDYDCKILQDCGLPNNTEIINFVSYKYYNFEFVLNFINQYGTDIITIYSDRNCFWFHFDAKKIGIVNLYPSSWIQFYYPKFHTKTKMRKKLLENDLQQKHNILIYSCEHGFLEIVVDIINNHSTFLNPHHMNDLAFCKACENNNFEIAKILKYTYHDINHKHVKINRCKSPELIEWLQNDCPMSNNTKSSRK